MRLAGKPALGGGDVVELADTLDLGSSASA